MQWEGLGRDMVLGLASVVSRILCHASSFELECHRSGVVVPHLYLHGAS